MHDLAGIRAANRAAALREYREAVAEGNWLLAGRIKQALRLDDADEAAERQCCVSCPRPEAECSRRGTAECPLEGREVESEVVAPVAA